MELASVSQDSYVARYTAQLARQAVGTGVVPDALAHEASRATLRRFSAVDRSLTAAECARMRAYFWAVVRGRSIRSRGAALGETRSFYLVLSVAEDLMSAGRAPLDIVREIEAEYSGEVTNRVMERVRCTVLSR